MLVETLLLNIVQIIVKTHRRSLDQTGPIQELEGKAGWTKYGVLLNGWHQPRNMLYVVQRIIFLH